VVRRDGLGVNEERGRQPEHPPQPARDGAKSSDLSNHDRKTVYTHADHLGVAPVQTACRGDGARNRVARATALGIAPKAIRNLRNGT